MRCQFKCHDFIVGHGEILKRKKFAFGFVSLIAVFSVWEEVFSLAIGNDS